MSFWLPSKFQPPSRRPEGSWRLSSSLSNPPPSTRLRKLRCSAWVLASFSHILWNPPLIVSAMSPHMFGGFKTLGAYEKPSGSSHQELLANLQFYRQHFVNLQKVGKQNNLFLGWVRSPFFGIKWRPPAHATQPKTNSKLKSSTEFVKQSPVYIIYAWQPANFWHQAVTIAKAPLYASWSSEKVYVLPSSGHTLCSSTHGTPQQTYEIQSGQLAPPPMANLGWHSRHIFFKKET